MLTCAKPDRILFIVKKMLFFTRANVVKPTLQVKRHNIKSNFLLNLFIRVRKIKAPFLKMIYIPIKFPI
jgi:hypothetical protein